MRTRLLWLVGALLAGTLVCDIGTASAEHHHSRRRKKTEAAQPESPAPAQSETPGGAPSAEPGAEAAATVEPLKAPRSALPHDGKPIATALMADDDLGPAATTDVLGAISTALGGDARLHFRDAVDIIEPSDGLGSLDLADTAQRDAQTAFDQMDLDKARARAEAAIATYRRHLPLLVAQPFGLAKLRDTWIKLASIRFLEGNSDGARDALRHVFALDPKLEWSAKLFPPQMKTAFQETRLLVGALGSGKISVTSTPEGAVVYLNGGVKGIAPLVVDDAPAGPSTVTLARRGYQPATFDVEVGGGGDESKGEGKLARWDDDPWGAVNTARRALGQQAEPPELVAASQRLEADLLVVVTGARTGAGITLTGYLYDARPKQLLRKAVRSGPEDKLAATTRTLALELLRNARLDGAHVAEEAVAQSGEGGWSTFRQSKWFWPVVAAAGGLVVVGGAVGLGVGLSHQGLSPAEKVILFGAQ